MNQLSKLVTITHWHPKLSSAAPNSTGRGPTNVLLNKYLKWVQPTLTVLPLHATPYRRVSLTGPDESPVSPLTAVRAAGPSANYPRRHIL